LWLTKKPNPCILVPPANSRNTFKTNILNWNITEIQQDIKKLRLLILIKPLICTTKKWKTELNKNHQFISSYSVWIAALYCKSWPKIISKGGSSSKEITHVRYFLQIYFLNIVHSLGLAMFSFGFVSKVKEVKGNHCMRQKKFLNKKT
jgi:hypothetical protein